MSAASSYTENKATIRARKLRDLRYGWAFSAPFTILFGLTFIVPIIVSIYQSFFKTTTAGGLYGGGKQITKFVGLDNYVAVVTNEQFWQGMGRVMLFGLFQIPFMIIAALALALVLDSYLLKRPTVFRLGYFLPYAIPGVVAAMMWMYLYSPQLSPLANMTTWTFTGYNMLVFLAALKAIPTDLYEAARLDGCSGFQVAMKIKVPMLTNAALLTVLLSIIGTIQLFNEPTVMRAGQSWMGNSYTPMMMAYSTMMTSPGNPNMASAISMTMAIIAALLAAVYAFVQTRGKR